MKWLDTEETVRFNEVDTYGIAWYGHYIAWFDVGRMALLKQFNLRPQDMISLGYMAPVVDLKCTYKHPARCGDVVLIRTTVVKPEIAALIFRFEINRTPDRTLLARGETTQVLMTVENKMLYRLQGELKQRVETMLAHFSG